MKHHCVAGISYIFFMHIFNPYHNLTSCSHFMDGKAEAQGKNLCLEVITCVMEVIIYRLL